MPEQVSPRPSRRRIPGRLSAVVATVFALIGVLLIVLASCSSTTGAPQPSASVAGTIDADRTVASTSQAATPDTASQPAGSESSSAPASSLAPTGSTTRSSRATSAAKASPTAKASSARPSAVATPKKTPIAVPSFTAAAKGLVLQASPPVSIRIPAIKVTSSILNLGLNPDGTIQVPPLDEPESKAGWYKDSPAPGSVGPSIILGHIDSKKYGPAVFYLLGTLKPGDVVEVTRQDHSVAVFKIDGVRSYPKDKFPTNVVYGNLDHAGLRLITCGGTFDPQQGSYESNIIAFASLVSAK